MMSTRDILEVATFSQCAMDLAVLAVMVTRRSVSVFPQLGWLLWVELLSGATNLLLLYFRRAVHLELHAAFHAFFLFGWIFSGLLLMLRILVVYGVFAEAMRPFNGLHQAGKMVFRWVGVVSALVAMALLAGPGAFSGVDGWLNLTSHLQQGVNVLTLCLLVFVCFAIRPLGLTFRSHLFGVSLGLGIAATVDLVQAAWFVTAGAKSLYSPIFVFSSLGFCAALCVWGTYFALPDPARKMILLPTTSPFFFWNRISEILGDAPGHVAVAGFTPDMLAPAEIEMLTAATAGEVAAHETQPPPARNRELSPGPEFAGRPRPSMAL